MKKISILLLCAILLSSCSMTLEELFLIPTATPTASKTITVTVSPIPSATPTVPTPTFTVTPTPIVLRTDTPTPGGSITPTSVTFTPFNLITPDTLTPTVVMEGFLRVIASEAKFYKKGCEPGVVKITAQVARPVEVSFVVLFVRFKSKQTGSTSEWTSIGMQHIGAGTYIHDLLPDEMKGVDIFKNAWVEYQFVATDSNSVERGRTEIFSESLTLLECIPTPTVTATSTPLKP